MKNRLIRSIIIAILLGFSIVSYAEDENNPAQNSVKNPIIVSVTWLNEHINDSGLIIFHVASTKGQYKAGHIPGARFLWRYSLIEYTPESSVVPPDVIKITEVLETLGVTDTSRIVLCGSYGNVSVVSRVFATLEYAGMSGRVFILNGGYEEWVAEGGAVEKKTPVVEKSKFTPSLNPDVFVSAEYILNHMGKDHFMLIDARSPRDYSGESGYPRKGHIPGAVNIYADKSVDENDKFLEAGKLQELFANAGVKPGSDLTIHCHVGQSASMLYVAARELGYKVHIYDGSFEEWSAREDLPLEIQPKPAGQPEKK